MQVWLRTSYRLCDVRCSVRECSSSALEAARSLICASRSHFAALASTAFCSRSSKREWSSGLVTEKLVIE